MIDTDSPFLKSIKRIVILIIALAIGLFLGGYLTYQSIHQQKPAAEEKQHPKETTATGSLN